MNRPRSLEAFAHFTKLARQVRSFTVSPAALGHHLAGVSEAALDELRQLDPPAGVGALSEDLPADLVQRVQHRWHHLPQMPVRAQAKWIQSASAVSQTYDAAVVVQALRDLGLFEDDDDFGGPRLSLDLLGRLAPAFPGLCLAPWSTVAQGRQSWLRVRLVLPAGCVGAFVGLGGSAIKARAQRLSDRVASAAIPFVGGPRVQLSVVFPAVPGSRTRNAPCVLSLTLQWVAMAATALDRETMGAEMQAKAQTLKHELQAELEATYRLWLDNARRLRQSITEAHLQQGREYHEGRRHELALRRAQPSASRAVLLPPADHCESYTRHRTRHFPEYRRALAARQKRKELLRIAVSCDVAGPLPHGLAAPSGARRLQRQLRCCSVDVAEAALAALRVARKAADCPCPLRPRGERRRFQPRGSRRQRQMDALRPELGLGDALLG